LRPGGGPIELVGEETGLVATTPLESVARGRLAPFVAQLMACLILAFLMKGVAFGRLVDPTVVRRRQFSEHVRALGTQYARARAARHTLGAYGQWVIDRLRERIRLPGDRAVGALAAAIAARTERPLGEVARLVFEARRDDEAAAREEPSRAVAEGHLATMRGLRQLLADTGGGARTRTTTITMTGVKPEPSPSPSPSAVRTTATHTTHQEPPP